MDLASEDETAEAVERTVEALGRIDVLINAAGTDAPGTVEELDVEGWDRTLAVNLRHPEKGGEGNTTGTRRTSTTGWLADRLGVEIIALTGAHTPYLDHPAEMAEAIQPFLWQVSQPGQSDRVQAVRRKR